ncbi:MAG: methyltransferase domain-containing protein [Candidatus Auribacterota bacterium]|nr:methyltransferase domain-containing protein [Candidatus Auribacterota bacterium]
MLYLDTNFVKKLIEFCLKNGTKSHSWITRFSMYEDLKTRLKNDDSSDKTCLSISNSLRLFQTLGLSKTKITNTTYPEVNMINMPFDDNTFDFCVSDQILEHIEGDPFTAVKESVRVVKQGGIIVHTTCFVNRLHGDPKDFWRFSTDALRLLCESGGAQVEHLGSWGNRMAWLYCQLGYLPELIPAESDNPINELARFNEPEWPICTWVIARKKL